MHSNGSQVVQRYHGNEISSQDFGVALLQEMPSLASRRCVLMPGQCLRLVTKQRTILSESTCQEGRAESGFQGCIAHVRSKETVKHASD